jgi:hypothetical protein
MLLKRSGARYYVDIKDGPLKPMIRRRQCHAIRLKSSAGCLPFTSGRSSAV